MALMEIKTYPDPVLREECTPVTEFGEPFRKLVEDMAETMYANDGVGLAAPQVGLTTSFFIIDVGEERGKELVVVANPEFIEKEGAIEWDEGCLSLPELTVHMKRFGKVKVKAQDVDGNPFEIAGEGLLAIALQHENDHLQGRLLIDYLSPLKRRLVVRDLKKLKEKQQRDA